MLRDLTRRAWVAVGLTWVRTVCLAVAYVAVGGAVDAARAGAAREIVTRLVLATLLGALAVGCAGLAAAEPPRLQAREELAWRGRLVRAFLARDPVPGTAAGRWVSRLTDGVERVAAYRATFLGPTLAAFTAPTLVLAVMAVAVDEVVAAVLVGLIVLVPFVVSFFMRVFRRANATFRRLAAAAAGRFHETLRSLGTLRLLGATDAARDVVVRASEDLRREVSGMLRRNQLMILVNDALFSVVMITAAVTVALLRQAEGEVTAGGVLATILLATLLHEPIDKVGRSFYVGMGGRAQQQEMAPLIEGSAPAPVSAGPEGTAGPVGVELRGVEVRRGDRPVVSGVDVSVPAGGALAIVGPTGAGKSSLVAAVQGLLATSAGRILVAGREAGANDLRHLVSTVPQRPFLFTGTVAENLRIARGDATDDELWQALDRARLARDVLAMPEGLDTAAGEAGVALSGGQVRRLAIARALLSESPVLVLDEPTADLDRRTEDLVTASLRDMAGTRTLIVVAHRLRTTGWADLVLVLDRGGQVAVGPPEVLADDDGYYAVASTSEETPW